MISVSEAGVVKVEGLEKGVGGQKTRPPVLNKENALSLRGATQFNMDSIVGALMSIEVEGLGDGNRVVY